MKKLSLLGYFMMFLKIDMTIDDSSYLYIVTNLIGAALLFYMSRKADKKMASPYMINYIFINLLILSLHFMDFDIQAVALSTPFSYLISGLVLLCHFYAIFYPVVSFFTKVTKENDSFPFTYMNLIMTSAFILMPILFITFLLVPNITPVFIITIVALEFLALLLLLNVNKAHSKSRQQI